MHNIPRGHIFDFDGVLCLSEELHFHSFQEVLAPFDATFDWPTYESVYMHFDSRGVFTRALAAVGRSLLPDELADLVRQKAASFLRLIEKAPPPPYPGALEAVTRAAAHGPIALCTAAERSDVEPILRRFGIRDLFTAVVTAEDVETSKPDPACYRLAAQLLGLPPSNCLAIEDTPGGLRAARGAGCQTLGVTQTHSAEQLAPLADRLIPTLLEFTV